VLRGRPAVREDGGHRARAAEIGEERVILTALCGHGHLDLAAYDAYLSGQVTDHSWDDEDVQQAVAAALAKLPAGVT
jgi:tryptophan synthase beta chain